MNRGLINPTRTFRVGSTVLIFEFFLFSVIRSYFLFADLLDKKTTYKKNIFAYGNFNLVPNK